MDLKKLFSVLTSIFILSSLQAKTFDFQEENCSGTITYNDTGAPGDAVFARMTLRYTKNSKKKSMSETKAVLELLKNGKKTDSAQFYFISGKSKHASQGELLSAVPLSLWIDSKDEYGLKVLFSLDNGKTEEINLPFEIQEREFEKEILDLDEKNSSIKQNNSAERMAQIEKLNNILGTVIPDDIYTLKPFIRPVKSERMTAHCGDRRIYKYTNGKSETSLHYGNDYGVPEGTEVMACGEGRIVMAEFRISTGWSVVIEHLPGLYSLYYHMSSLNVKENQYVHQGDKIGFSGSTGLATGPHLHWEIRLNMAAVIPEFFMKDFTFENVK